MVVGWLRRRSRTVEEAQQDNDVQQHMEQQDDDVQQQAAQQDDDDAQQDA
jgi:hypothetical protein